MWRKVFQGGERKFNLSSKTQWHSVCKSAGSPSTGVLRDIMARTRNKYHYSIRKVKKEADTIRATKLLAAAATSDINLMKEMKNIKGSSKGGQSVPDSVDGVSGHEEIVDKFKEVYEELYNSAPTVDSVNNIKNTINNLIGPGCMAEVDRVTGSVLKEACARMKPGKSDVTGSYSSDILLHAPDNIFEELAAVFRSFLTHGDVTLQLLSCAFLPLFKGGLKDPGKSDSYRAIAGSSQLLKLFDYVVILLWGDLLHSDSLQFGFKSGVSTTQCSWLVMEVVGYY